MVWPGCQRGCREREPPHNGKAPWTWRWKILGGPEMEDVERRQHGMPTAFRWEQGHGKRLALGRTRPPPAWRRWSLHDPCGGKSRVPPAPEFWRDQVLAPQVGARGQAARQFPQGVFFPAPGWVQRPRKREASPGHSAAQGLIPLPRKTKGMICWNRRSRQVGLPAPPHLVRGRAVKSFVVPAPASVWRPPGGKDGCWVHGEGTVS